MLSKRPSGTLAEKESLSAAKLHSVTDAELLSYLYATVRTLRSASAPFSIEQEFVKLLLTPRYLRSTIPDVQQLVGCAICDVIRLHSENSKNGSSGRAATGTLPFPASCCDDVLACLASPFAQVFTSGAPLQRCEYIVDRASASHVLAHILPHCRQYEKTAEHLQRFFSVLKNAGVSSSSASASASSSPSSTTLGEMAVLLRDILDTTNSITVEQLEPLLGAITQSSRTLTRGGGGGASSSAQGQTVAPLPAYLIASRVLLDEKDLLQPALAAYATREMDKGAGEVLEAEHAADSVAVDATATTITTTAAIAPSSSSSDSTVMRHSGLRRMSRVFEALVALTEIHVHLVSNLIQALIPYVEHEHPDVRLLSVRGFAAAFMANEAAIGTYKTAFTVVLGRFQDVKPAVRIEAALFAGSLIATATGSSGSSGTRQSQAQQQRAWSSATQREAWQAIKPYMTQRLTDPHAAVRRQVVVTYCDILQAMPFAAHDGSASGGVPNAAQTTDGERQRARGGGSGEPEEEETEERVVALAATSTLANTLGLRTADKNTRVREAAVQGLCRVYRAHLLPWIPDAVMNSLKAEGGVRHVELVLESMLPSPMDRSTSSRGGGNQTKEERGRSSHQHRNSREELALFDFEKAELRDEQGFLAALVRLCGDLSPHAFHQLIAMAKKKQQLRLTVRRLFEMRAQVRQLDPQSSEGQGVINGIHRLLLFLQDITHAEKKEWDTLFRSKDDKVSKTLLQACSTDTVDWCDARSTLMESLSGRLPKETLTFVTDVLGKQMFFPLQLSHLKELQERLKESSSSGAMTVQPQGFHIKEEEKLLRCLLFFAVSSPSYLPRCATSLLFTLNHIIISSGRKQSILASRAPSCLLAFQGLDVWAAAEAEAAAQNPSPSSSSATAGQNSSPSLYHSVVSAESRNHLQATLAKICTGDITISQDGDAPTAGGSCARVLRRVVKQAARCLISLLAATASSSSSSSSSTTSMMSVLAKLTETLRMRIAEKSVSNSTATLTWVTSVRTLVQSAECAPLLQDAGLASHLTQLMAASVKDTTDAAAETARVSPSSGALATNVSVAASITDACAKALIGLAMSYPVDRRSTHVSAALESLLQSYKLVCELAASGLSNRAGSQLRRLSIEKQLAKLLIYPTADIGKELAIAVIFSSEEDSAVRLAVQTKLAAHLIARGADMRYAALLLLTAISDDTKSSYQELRTLVQLVGDDLRSKQTSQGTSLSSPQALFYYLEYAIPFLVLFMAHHTFFESESQCHFISFQRVWHLLFDELFRHGTQGASFLVELVGRIKQSDDILDRASTATRMMCDLCSRTMLECLGQRQVSSASLKRYPGAILLPSFFVKTANSDPQGLLDAVFLDPAVVVTAHVPFRVPTLAAGTGALGESRLSTPRQSMSRATEEANDATSQYTPYGGRSTRRSASDSARPSMLGGTPHSPSPPQQQQQSGRKRGRATEPISIDEAAHTNNSSSDSRDDVSARRAAVDIVLRDMLRGLTQGEIARLRWKLVKDRIEAGLAPVAKTAGGRKREETAAVSAGDDDVEELLNYAKEQLKTYYEHAEAA